MSLFPLDQLSASIFSNLAFAVVSLFQGLRSRGFARASEAVLVPGDDVPLASGVVTTASLARKIATSAAHVT